MEIILTDFFIWCVYRRTKIGEKTADFLLENSEEINLYVNKKGICFFEYNEEVLSVPEYVCKQLKIFCKEKGYKYFE